ncbi:TPR repeat-containing protein [Legionella birminghamensis]|uniref:TPR repeat protein, SEL1 subfamily n=2 Tax=Legionella birminghamensis TaxID=28083 RepID=A0A378I7V1_9GAMM|nr:TPR repeat-containing protein [Legionella birminghamensis]STX30856.1 TPR repeat protein, SEL1 subfamily [Legionella birminghamensis]
MLFFSEQPENIEGLTAEELNDCGWYFYQRASYEKAVPYFQLAALAGQEQALVNLGVCYHWAQGIEKDDEAAVLCFELAADKNNPQALYNLGMAYEEGWYDGAINTAKALSYYIQAARLKDSESVCQLGWYAENGIYPVIQNFSEAYKQYLKADELGSARAAYNLGRCYESGKGTKQDLDQALECYQRAYERGYVKAEAAIARIENKQSRVSCTLL